jgi:D-3-phosphoglycerate dehydrogenase
MKLLGNDIIEIDHVFLAETGVEMTTLDDLLGRADFISLNCDLNPTSHHLINGRTLTLINQYTVLINTARGPIVEEAALEAALIKGTIGGAALDVFEIEPLPLDSPFRKLDNVLVAPHNANSSPTAWERVNWNTIKNLVEGLGITYRGVE